MDQGKSGQASPSFGSDRSAMDLRRVHLWEIQAVRDALVIGLALGLVWLGYVMRSVTVPLLVALMLAYLFEPVIAWAGNRYRLKRPVVVTGLVCSIIVVLVLCIAIAVPLIVGQTMTMVRDLRAYRLERIMISLREKVPATMLESYDSTAESVADFFGSRYRPPKPKEPPTTAAATQADGAPTTGPKDIGEVDRNVPVTEAISIEIPLTDDQVRDMIAEEVERQLALHPPVVESASSTSQTTPISSAPVASIWQISRSTAGAIFSFLGNVLQIGFLFFLIPFYLFFFSLWYPHILEFGRGLIPRANEARTLDLLRKMDAVIAAFVRGRIVISVIIGIICAIGWTICDVPNAIVLGLITGVFSAVPYLGFIGLPIAILMLWVDQMGVPASVRTSTLWIIAGPSLVYIIMQVLETYIITPAIAGKATNLDPVTILVAVLAGGSVGGVYGMLLAIPAAACLKILLTDVVMPRVRMWVRGKAEDPLPL